MRSQLRKIGNSTGAIIPKALLNELGITEGDEIEISVNADEIIIKKKADKPRYTLTELLAKCDPNAPNFTINDWDNGQPVGDEIW